MISRWGKMLYHLSSCQSQISAPSKTGFNNPLTAAASRGEWSRHGFLDRVLSHASLQEENENHDIFLLADPFLPRLPV